MNRARAAELILDHERLRKSAFEVASRGAGEFFEGARGELTQKRAEAVTTMNLRLVRHLTTP